MSTGGRDEISPATTRWCSSTDRIASHRIRDAGQFFGDGPQSPLKLLVSRLRAGANDFRTALDFADAVGAVVLATSGIGVGGRAKRRQCTLVGWLGTDLPHELRNEIGHVAHQLGVGEAG